MGKIKIIFFDIDGTLLRLRAKELSEKTVEALNRLKANGIRLCIATGRTPVRSLLPLKAGWLPMDLTLICRIITRLLIYN